MIRINLLPVRQGKKLEAARREVALLGGLGVLVLVGCLGFWALTTARLSATNQENAQLEAEIQRLSADAARVDEMEKFKGELERKLDVIAELRGNKQGPVHMLEDLATATPERLTVTEMEEKGGNIKIQGVSVSNEVISQFLRQLEASDYFDAVYLEDIEAKSEGAGGSVVLKEFRLTARLVTPPAPQTIPTEAPAGDVPAGGAAPAVEGGATGAATPAAPEAPAQPAAGGGA